jgi:hypothetical protein
MTIIPCNRYKAPPHEISAQKTDEGLAVTFDGETKTIPLEMGPSPELLGNSNYFGTHEHCILDAASAVNEVLMAALEA